VSRNEILSRERRWMLPAALAAFGAAVLGFAAGVLQVQAYDGADDQTGLLLARHADTGTFTTSVVLEVLSWILLAVPFAYLFFAAAARSERVNKALVGLLAIAPILLAVGSVIVWQSYSDVADQFVEEKPALDAEAAALEEEASNAEETGGADGQAPNQQGSGGGGDQAGGGNQGGGGNQAQGEPGAPEEEPPTDEEEADEEEEDPVEARADELTDESSGLSTGFSISFGGLLGLAVGILYTCLQAMRVGLLTRFFGSLGMALAVALVLLQLLPGVLLYTVAVGLLILGRWPGGRPPAWESGRAIPWPRPGEQPDERAEPQDSETIEGRGEEVEPDEGPEEPSPQPGPSEPRRKRKRRR
jgi:hypothetical protein